jgi:hypothetical protein
MTTKDNEVQEWLAQNVKLAPSREWVNSYFDLVKQVLDITGLKMMIRASQCRYRPIKTAGIFQ